jgi:hypothetical protein
MTINSDTGRNALQFKAINGLQIQYAISEKDNESEFILQLSPLPENGILREEER